MGGGGKEMETDSTPRNTAQEKQHCSPEPVSSAALRCPAVLEVRRALFLQTD